MSKTTKTLLGAKAREAVHLGVNAIYVPVGRTLGPHGKNALLYRTYNRGSRITNDGKTVAECQEPKDPFVNLAANAFKEVCRKTDEKVGDGTTTTAVIGGVLMNSVHTLLSEGSTEFTAKSTGSVSAMTMRKNILDTAEQVKSIIKDKAKKIETLEDLEKIATISVEDPALGKVIAKMAWDVGVDGFIDTVEGYKGEIETEIIEGFRFPAKVPAKAFINNPARFEMVVKDCPIFITNYELDNAQEIAKVLQKFNGVTSKIIVVAPSFSENVLVNMINATKAGYFMHAVKVPALRTEQFEDLAVYCKANFIDKNKGKMLSNARVEDLGFLEKLIVKDTEAKEDAIATGGKGTKEETMTAMVEEEIGGKKKKVMKDRVSTAIADRIEMLKGQLIETQQPQFKKLLERRIASMKSSVGVIRVGDSTQASSLYRKLKIEDAVYATKAALRGGYVKGGGLCLKEIADTLPENNILRSALMAPYQQIQDSIEGGIEITEDIIDPSEVVYYAVEHATSVVAHLATLDVITVEVDETGPGDGYMAIAKALNELAINDAIHKGQMQESEREMARDAMGGLTPDEKVMLDNG